MAGTGHLLPNSGPRGPLKSNGYSDRPQPEPLPWKWKVGCASRVGGGTERRQPAATNFSGSAAATA